MKRVVILGGGLAGLSAGHHLAEHEPMVFEREATVGGLCRSFSQDGFTFDCTGHLIHFKHAYSRALLEDLLPGALDRHERLAAIHSHGTLTPYPFQANLHGLPPEVIEECLSGFAEASRGTPEDASPDFHGWVMSTFGPGIAKHFMLPYNEKFWKQDLRTITAEWASWSIPKPTLEEVANGAQGRVNVGMGYNPRFIYPRSGGIDCLPQALAKRLRHVHLRESAQSIDPRRKIVRFGSGREESYDSLIVTLPLPAIFRLLEGVPDALRDAASRLRAIGVLNINLGIDRPGVSDQHWIYFPEGRFIFSRVGFPMNFSKAAAPLGASSLYVEITYPEGRKPDLEEAYARTLQGLEICGILRAGDRVLTRLVLDVDPAYVVFDAHRRQHLQALISYLESRDIHPAGRFGRWDYHSMEDSILSGKTIAEQVRSGTVEHRA